MYLGIDIGTTNLKAIVISNRCEIVAEETATYELQFLDGGGVEQDAHAWWQALCTVIGRLERRGVEVRGIKSLAVSGHGCALVAVDRVGRVLRPAINSLDTRCFAQTERIRNDAGELIIAANGNGVGAFNFEPKLLWLKEHEPAVYDSMICFLSPTSYINFRLTGNRIMNVSDGGLSMAYDRKSGGCWSEPVIRAIGLDAEKFPALAACGDPIGAVISEAAQVTGLPEGIPVLAGGEDTSSAALSMGVTSPGMAYLSMGTQCTVGVCTDRFSGLPELLGFPHVLKGLSLLNGSMSACGGAMSWFVREWCRDLTEASADKDEAYRRLTAETAAARPGAKGLLFLPYLTGELHPILDEKAKGVFFGLKLEHTRADMARAVMEGTAHAIRHNLHFAERAAGRIGDLHAVGGPTRNEVWCQAIADITGKPVRVIGGAGSFSGAPLGNAILAMGTAVRESAEKLAARFLNLEKRYEPNEANRDKYDRQHDVYIRLYERTKDLFPLLEDGMEVSRN